MKGHIRERSPGRWAIVLDATDPATGKRRRKWHSFEGTKRQAETECARLIKGYGDTHKRGSDNYRTIEERVIRPALAGAMPLGPSIDAIASARTAALKDPEGESLARCLADIEQHASFKIAAE